MPWKESDVMSERIKFVSRLLEGEKMTDLCKEFGISRKTGHKIFNRYKVLGVEGIPNLSRSPKSRPNQTPKCVEEAILQVKAKYPTWGAPKIKAYLERENPTENIPAKSTVHTILCRYDLVKKRRKKGVIYRAKGTKITSANQPNEVWCTDFKGQFRLKNNKYCYPLTISDRYSRFLIMCEGLEATKEDECIFLFNKAFEEFGLPEAILSDNGVPFASVSYFGLSKLSVWWIRNGIKILRIRPGNPQENGSHERMHRTLKAEATKPPSSNLLSQQEQFDSFKTIYNFDRPHQAIENKTPSDIYQPSKKKFNPFQEPFSYPEEEITARVSSCGRIRINGWTVHIGRPFGGENVGVTEAEDGVFRVMFMDYTLGYFDTETQVLQVPKNPFLN